jgi:multiple sugar transport system substrate-binding protein
MMGNEKYSNIVSHMEDLSDPALKFSFDCLRSGLINKDASGKVYMVPIFSRTYGMLVNNDLFKKENINVPEKWSDLLSACTSFASKSYNPIMGYTKDKKPSSGLMNVIAYPQFVAELAKNPEALAKANNLDPSAGEYMRNSLTLVKNLVDGGAINISKCDEIGDNYEKVLLRFFEGDVPMMVCNGDTVSGAKKREAKSEAYQANPFNYSFYPIPVTDKGGYFIDSPSLEFSVNKDCENLDMTNEFMRFLLRTKELQNMASLKGLIPSTKSTSFDAVYAPFGKVPSDRTISPEVIGVKDQLATQIRLAAYKVGKGELTIDEAVAQYGSLE